MEILAPVRRLRAHRELVGARRRADAEIVATTLPSPRLAWRTSELCSTEHRRALAESLIGIARASEARYLPNASPLNRVAARDQLASTVDALAERANPSRIADDVKAALVRFVKKPPVAITIAGVGTVVLVVVYRKIRR